MFLSGGRKMGYTKGPDTVFFDFDPEHIPDFFVPFNSLD